MVDWIHNIYGEEAMEPEDIVKRDYKRVKEKKRIESMSDFVNRDGMPKPIRSKPMKDMGFFKAKKPSKGSIKKGVGKIRTNELVEGIGDWGMGFQF